MATPSRFRVERFSFGLPWEGSHGYSQGVRVGDTLHISGQIPHDEKGDLIGVGDPAAQMVAALRNLERVLAAFATDRRAVVETRIMVVHPSDNFAAISAEHRRFFGDLMPASTAFGVSELVFPGQLVEVSAVARIGLGA